MGTFIDSTHMKLLSPFEVISSGCNALVVPFQQILEGPHGCPLVWACQWPLSQPLSSPQLSHNDSPLSLGNNQKVTGSKVLDYREAEELSWCPSWSNSLWQGMELWTGVLSWWKMPLTRFEDCWPLPKESLPETALKTSNIVKPNPKPF